MSARFKNFGFLRCLEERKLHVSRMKVGSLQKKAFKSFLIVLTAVCFSSKNYIIYVYKAKVSQKEMQICRG